MKPAVRQLLLSQRQGPYTRFVKPQGSFESSAGILGFTISTTVVSPVPFTRVRLRMFNVCAPAVVGVTAGLAVSANMTGGVHVATGTPQQVKVAGSTSWTLPAALSGGGGSNHIWSETVSDWVSVSSVARSDGGSGYLLVVRVFQPSAGNTAGNRVAGLGSTASDVNTYGCAAVVGASDTTFSSWVSQATTVLGLGGGFGVEIDAPSGCVPVVGFGDSTMAGTDNTAWNGGGLTMAGVAKLSALSPIVWWNQGEASMASGTYLQLAESFFQSGLRAKFAGFCAFSPNDADKYTVAGTARQIAGIGTFMALCRKYGARPILVTPCPVGALTAAEEDFRRQVVVATKNLVGDGLLVDRDAIYTDYGVAAGGWLAGMGGPIHPSATGYSAEGSLWQTALSPFTSLANYA